MRRALIALQIDGTRTEPQRRMFGWSLFDVCVGWLPDPWVRAASLLIHHCRTSVDCRMPCWVTLRRLPRADLLTSIFGGAIAPTGSFVEERAAVTYHRLFRPR